eukprot:11819393-Ditylum_brightwellii.AAC.1
MSKKVVAASAVTVRDVEKAAAMGATDIVVVAASNDVAAKVAATDIVAAVVTIKKESKNDQKRIS